MSRKLGAMVVGPGWVAGEHIKAYVNNPKTELRVIAGVLKEDKARAEKYMKERDFQCDYSDSYVDALKRDDVDVVSVCTINFLHYEQSLAAIEAGKHVLTEKPLALSIREVKSLVDAAHERKVKTHVGHVCRFYPAVQVLAKEVRQGKIGEIFYGECDYWHEIKGEWKTKIKTGGSSLLMGGVHSVDMVRHLMGEDRQAEEVFGWTVKAARRKDYEYPPTVAFLVRFRDGAVAKVACSIECNMPYVFHIQMCGTKGAVRNKGIFISEGPEKTKGFAEPEGDYPDDWDVAHHPFPEEVGYFVDCILKDTESELSFKNAYSTYELIFAAEESARTGKPVKLPLPLASPLP